MENASKALVIAGAILISILLITLGIIVYNGSRSTIDESMGSMDETSITMTNSKISQYEGNKVTASNVRALFNQVQTTAKVTGRPVTFDTTTANAISDVTNVQTGKTYKVKVVSYDSQGLISQVQVRPN